MRGTCTHAPLPPATHSVHSVTLSPLSCLLRHVPDPLCSVLPSSHFHAEMQYSTDLELMLDSVPSPAPFWCLNGPPYTILTTMISSKHSELSPPISHLQQLLPASSHVPLSIISQLLHYLPCFKD